MNIGFYGGRQGKDFSISSVFPNKVKMDEDLAMSWTSPVSVGEYVVISYGMVHDIDYDYKKEIDLKAYGKSYNSTLWRKEYVDADGTGSAAGLRYRLISSMTGNTPKMIVNEPITVLDADEMPDVDGNNTDPDFFYITFKLPQNQILVKKEDIVLNADQEPSVDFDETDINRPALTFSLPQSQVLTKREPFVNVLAADQEPEVTYDDETNINRPVIGFNLPQSQVIENITVTIVDSNEEPQVVFDTTYDGTINRPVLHFTLPKAQIIALGETIEADADTSPSVDIDNSNPSNPILTFTLPQAQVMGNAETEVIGPNEAPNVELDSTNINAPFLKFALPRAVKFYYGDKLGSRESKTYVLESEDFADYAIGDYYVNSATGFIYLITAKTDNECTFEYQASIQQPLPAAVAISIDPYVEQDGDYVPAAPTVSRAFTNADGTQWQLTFGMPQAPTPQVTTEWLGPEEEGQGADAVISGTNTIAFNFRIPQGAKIFSGTEIANSASADIEASIGDIYLNTETGDIFKWLGSSWELQDGNLKGPVGDALNVVRSYNITGVADTLAEVSAEIEKLYVAEDGTALPITPDQIFAVAWIGDDGEGGTTEIYYWYFKTAEGIWGRVQLTGGVSSLLENVYNNESDGEVTNKTYSINYINKLVNNTTTVADPATQTFSAEQIIALSSWGTFEELINEQNGN